MFHTVVAHTKNNGIGFRGAIPWKSKLDTQHFKELTSSHIVIMGRKTFESIGGKPLPNRLNIVLSKTLKPTNLENVQLGEKEAIFFSDIWECVAFCEKLKETVFVIGGEKIYEIFLQNGLISSEYRTAIVLDVECDTFYPRHNKTVNSQIFKTVSDGVAHVVYLNTIVNEEEERFLALGREILRDGISSSDRTGTGTLSLFGKTLQFDLSNNTFPMMTSRKMFLRGVFEELIFFIRGQTDNTILTSKNVNIWKANTTREFLDKRGLQHLPEGDFGPSYGFLMRHFGAEYKTCKHDYTGQGVDQLARVIHTLRTNPTDRRMIISLWDPNVIDKCPIPPCLFLYEFYVRNGCLDCMMVQRSSDFIVAGGWNISTGSLLTLLIASVTNLKPGKLVWNLGNVHIYNNLIETFKLQLNNKPFIYPKIFLNPRKNIEDYEFSDIKIVNYMSHPPLKFEMSV